MTQLVLSQVGSLENAVTPPILGGTYRSTFGLYRGGCHDKSSMNRWEQSELTENLPSSILSEQSQVP